MNHATTPDQDPAAIERDIRRTQDEMSRTVDRIGDQLTPRNLLNALLDKAEENDIDARYLLDGARRNPLALAMLAGGAIWLLSDSDAKLPKIRSGTANGGAHSGSGDHHDPYHRDYIAHMERVERFDGEDELAYQRRRDLARANYFMLERAPDEDEHGFRQRIDRAAEAFRDKRRAWADSTREAGHSMRESGDAAIGRAREAFSGNPLIGGLVAAAAGAILGTALPLSRTEQDRLAGTGEAALDKIGERKDEFVSAAREKKDEMIERVEERAQTSSSERDQTAAHPMSQREPMMG